jgi:hypothetical protein
LQSFFFSTKNSINLALNKRDLKKIVMKKALLLLTAGLIAGVANAQQSHQNLLLQTDYSNNNLQSAQAAFGFQGANNVPASSHAAAKTTAGPGGKRWYAWGAQILPIVTTHVASRGIDIWNDTTALFGYTGGTGSPYSGVDITSVGLGFNPAYTVWNDPTNFPGEIAIAPGDAFNIDSVEVAGWYNRNYSKPTVVDTLIFTFTSGTGTSTSNMPPNYFNNATTLANYGITTPPGQLNFKELLHDSLNNRAGQLSGSTVVPITSPTAVYKFLLFVSDTNNSNSFRGTQFPRTSRGGHPADPIINYAVPSGNLSAMSVTFKSGDTWPGAFISGGHKDTVRYSDGTTVTGYKYGSYLQEITYASVADPTVAAPSPAATFPPYFMTNTDWTAGYFKRENAPSWGGQYLPHYAFIGANTLQYPTIDFHAVCTTCYLTGSPTLGVNSIIAPNSVIAYPNPATNELNISFSSKVPVTVTLSNMLGQIVATDNVANGHSTINTTAIPAGVYIFTLNANGERTTGRVVIGH